MRLFRVVCLNLTRQFRVYRPSPSVMAAGVDASYLISELTNQIVVKHFD